MKGAHDCRGGQGRTAGRLRRKLDVYSALKILSVKGIVLINRSTDRIHPLAPFL